MLTSELAIRSILLGAGLAMDAFSVSLADGLAEPAMRKRRMAVIAGVFALFQFAMPMIGWLLVRTAVDRFRALETYIPWIALLLLLYIGGKMLLEGLRSRNGAGGSSDQGSDVTPREPRAASASDLILQGIATSIDALSVGFTIETYGPVTAFISSLIIGVVTYVICVAGLNIGKKAGTRISGKASIAGGVILIAIGFEIWIKGLFF